MLNRINGLGERLMQRPTCAIAVCAWPMNSYWCSIGFIPTWYRNSHSVAVLLNTARDRMGLQGKW